ncbi:hypothetical protein [Algoriphagus sp. CAU 1675]|uniref:hypothetical protein n=1 Tax=Algoriphagus sp. CAU 1675 TaxID=3032597 RepID=UPI0023DA706D|nr:hypothetical protein [Algoriphagus sp. CAU 1675]MDF2159326.1 hypothetical protein [Algoriphagus sp. CAU 1675]
MGKLPQLLFFSILLLSFSCKTYRPVQNLKPKNADRTQGLVEADLQKLRIGDHVIVVTFADEILKGELIRIMPQGLEMLVKKSNGVNEEKEQVRSLDLGELKAIKVKRFSGGATAGFVLGMGTVAVLAAAAMFLVLLGAIFSGF